MLLTLSYSLFKDVIYTLLSFVRLALKEEPGPLMCLVKTY